MIETKKRMSGDDVFSGFSYASSLCVIVKRTAYGEMTDETTEIASEMARLLFFRQEEEKPFYARQEKERSC